MSASLDRQARRALEVLRAAGTGRVTLAQLKAAGVEKPGAALYELELAGYDIEHRPAGVRLIADPRPFADPAAGRAPGWPHAGDPHAFLAAILIAQQRPHRRRGERPPQAGRPLAPGTGRDPNRSGPSHRGS
jgi:hypothetical protein